MKGRQLEKDQELKVFLIISKSRALNVDQSSQALTGNLKQVGLGSINYQVIGEIRSRKSKQKK